MSHLGNLFIGWLGVSDRTSPGNLNTKKLTQQICLQAYVAAEGDCEERGTGVFPVEEVHKIAILDMRLANCDRNGGNILVKRCSGKTMCQWQLIPIDHGYCLPSTFADISFEWMFWPQVLSHPSASKSRVCLAVEVHFGPLQGKHKQYGECCARQTGSHWRYPTMC